jgi:hypothetical protein
MSLFITGLVLSHYNLHNLSEDSRVSGGFTLEAMANTAETLVFISVGLAVFTTDSIWDAGFIVVALVACLVSRALNIFPLARIANLCRRREIPFNMQLVMFFSGLRGSVAFALSMQLDPSVPGVSQIQSTTLALVLITTIALGTSASLVVDRLDMRVSHDAAFQALDGGEDDDSTSHYRWRRFDDVYFKPIFGGSEASEERRRILEMRSARVQHLDQHLLTNIRAGPPRTVTPPSQPLPQQQQPPPGAAVVAAVDSV